MSKWAYATWTPAPPPPPPPPPPRSTAWSATRTGSTSPSLSSSFSSPSSSSCTSLSAAWAHDREPSDGLRREKKMFSEVQFRSDWPFSAQRQLDAFGGPRVIWTGKGPCVWQVIFHGVSCLLLLRQRDRNFEGLNVSVYIVAEPKAWTVRRSRSPGTGDSWENFFGVHQLHADLYYIMT